MNEYYYELWYSDNTFFINQVITGINGVSALAEAWQHAKSYPISRTVPMQVRNFRKL